MGIVAANGPEWYLRVVRYKRRHRVVGLLYFHRISDNRAGLKNLLLYHGLCGEHFGGRIIFTTTMWDEVGEETGASREEKLKAEFWKPMIDSGSSVQRFRGSRESALKILAPILEDVHKDRFLLLHNEIEVLGRKLHRTAAGQALLEKLEELVSSLQETLVEFQTESTRSSIDPDRLQLLTNRSQDVSKQLQSTMRDAIRKTSPPARPRRVIKPARWTQYFG